MSEYAQSLPIDAALPELTAALRARNAARAGGAARRRQDDASAARARRRAMGGETRFWCSSRAGSPPALRPRGWQRRSARRSATRSAIVCASARRSRGATRIEIVTEGVFTRLILDDPVLTGVAAVIFDEFHERSLDADLGLALARDVQQGLREDLRLLVMSATLDGARVARAARPCPGDRERRAAPSRSRPAMSAAMPRRRSSGRSPMRSLRALRAEPGSLLVFLPGAAEIRRTEAFAARAARRSGYRHRGAIRRARRRRCRTARSRRRRPAGARSCWPRRSRKPRSPSRACAW